MAEIYLINSVEFAGDYGANAVEFVSNQASTTIVDGITATKSADKAYWISGPLTYTVTITNNSGKDFSNGVLTDALDTDLIKLDESAEITINDVATEDFAYAGGTLNVDLPTVTNGQTVTVAFKVLRA